MKFEKKSWISFGAGFVVVFVGGLMWNLAPHLMSQMMSQMMRAPASLNAPKFARSPASIKRLDEHKFPEKKDRTLLLWMRLDYQRVGQDRKFRLESHIVDSPVLKVPRNGAQSYVSGRFVSVPIYDENGSFVENIEFENPNFTAEPGLFGGGKSQASQGQGVQFEDGRVHSYYLRLPISDKLPVLCEVFRLGTDGSTASKALENEKLQKLEEIYILPAIGAVIKTESQAEASAQESAAIRINVLKAISNHFENPDTLNRLREEAISAQANINSLANVSSRTKRKTGRGVANVDLPPATVRTLSIVDDNGTPLTTRITNRIKLVFLGDGFQASEMETFFKAAQDKLDYIMQPSKPGNLNPLAAYRGMFNAVAIFVPSNESGACHPEKNTPCPDTIYKMSFNTSGIPRLLGMTSGGSAPYSATMRTYAPDYDYSVIIANDTAYGGGGGIPATVSMDPNASDVVSHELFGHSFAHLGDEYSAPYPGYPDAEEPNTTKNGDSATVKWAQWGQIDTLSMFGNPELVVKAPVEGAHYHATGWYRPAANCKMAIYGQPFCPVCSEAIVRAVYTKIKPIDAVTPAAGDVDTSAGGWSLNVLTAPIQSDMSIQWTINGQPVDLNGSATFTPDSLTAALAQYPDIASKGMPYAIKATVVDNTKLVTPNARQDNLLQQSVSWKLK